MLFIMVDNIITAVKLVEGFAQTLNNTNVTMEDMQILAEISPNISVGVESLKDWFKQSSPMEFRLVKFQGVKVSNLGDIYSLETGERLIPCFMDGDMRVNIDRSWKRASLVVARAWDIKAPKSTGYMIGFKDGDRRNISKENLIWVPEEKQDPKVLLIEDICRRLVQYAGNIDKTFAMYEKVSPKISRDYVDAIFKKEVFSEISDRFFTNEGGKLISMMNAEGQCIGIDCYGLLRQTHDIELVKKMLCEKVKLNQVISEQEKEIMFAVVSDGKDHKALWYSDRIHDVFNYEFLPAQIGTLQVSKSPSAKEIISIIKEASSNA